MQRISTLLQKISELSKENASVIEVDLMMDYTKVMYADLLEWRNRLVFNNSLHPENTISEPITVPEIQTAIPENTEDSDNYASIKEEEKEPKQEKTIVQVANPPGEETVYIQNEQPTNNVRTFIGINDKYQFISELFSNNKDAYNEVLDELNTMDTYNEAVNWLKMSVADQYNWDEDSPAVQSFYGMLSQFFSSM